MSVSSIPAAVTYLITMLNQTSVVTNPVPGFPIAVIRGAPLPEMPIDEAFVIQQAQRTTSRFQMRGDGGTGWLREDITIPIDVVCVRGGDDEVTMENRLWTMVGAAESAIRADPTLGGTVLEAWPDSTPFTSEWTEQNIGRRGICTINVSCWNVI